MADSKATHYSMNASGSIVLAPAGYDVSPDYGSDPERPWRLVEGLSRRGIQVTVVARQVARSSEFGPGVRLRLLPGKTPASPTGRLLDRISLYIYARKVALDELGHRSVLAVHHLSPCGPSSPSLLPKLPVPFVYGPMPNLAAVASPEGWNQWLGFRTSSWYQTILSRTVGGTVTPVARALWRRTMGLADAVTVEAAANIPVDRPDAVVIPMGLDLSLFSPGDTAPVPGRVVTVAALLPRKGIDILIEAVARVRRDLPAAHAVIAGEGPELQPLQELACKFGVQSAVSFRGRIARRELPDLYRSAVTFCHPARSDNFPTVVIEAMACGLPVLASDVGALPEMVGAAGLIHSRGDVDGLTEDLRTILSRPTLQRDLSLAAQERAVRVYSVDSMCDGYLKLYSRLSAKRKQPSASTAAEANPSRSTQE